MWLGAITKSVALGVASTIVPAGIAIGAASWHTVPSPNPGANGPYVQRYLREVTAASSRAVWAVGQAGNRSIIARWTGSAWRLESLPHPTTYALRAIDTNGPAVWALGAGPTSIIVLRHVGGGWRYSAIPGSPRSTFLTDLAVQSNTDVWIVGSAASSVAALAYHWNGTHWSSIPPPVPGGASGVQLNRVEHIPGTSRVIGVGYYVRAFHFYPYAVEWMGSAWKTLPMASTLQGELDGVVVRSASSAWAVGFDNPNAQYSKSLIEHWNGSHWRRVSSPDRAYGNYLLSVDARSNSDIWAVGYAANPKGYHTLAEHWNGSRWSLATTPDPNPSFNLLFGISFVPGTRTFWAVGTKGPARPALVGENTLTQRCTAC
jgi:hypothetical protein